MKYVVTLDSKINFAPENETVEILQNIRTIIATVIGAVPLDRELGISNNLIDQPLPVARMMLKQTIIEAIERDEPRATLKAVEFENNTDSAMEGVLKPRVIVSIGNDSDEED